MFCDGCRCVNALNVFGKRQRTIFSELSLRIAPTARGVLGIDNEPAHYAFVYSFDRRSHRSRVVCSHARMATEYGADDPAQPKQCFRC